MGNIPGIVPRYTNSNVSKIKAFPWTDVLSLLGKYGETIMLPLLLHCGIFIPLANGRHNYVQLSGLDPYSLCLVMAHLFG